MLLAVAGCGRINFDPRDDGGSGSGGGDGGSGADDGGLTGDSGALACGTNAIAVVVGRSAPVSTCQGSDAIDGCAAVANEEVVFRFDPTVTAS